ncbi:adenosine-specific kinase [Bryobacter aggregatus]|uniref:adenosine-specific kinase n=1 Tax=Bryobacter aggregatus TaxID=360054 RepID=UPI0004E1E196|nr:adenosine-specific kinase [Bryobacter aggregatus]
MEIFNVPLQIPEGANLIFGQSHFVKTVEDLYEAIINTNPNMEFGIAFCEASGDRLIRVEGNNETMKEAAILNAEAVGAGHTFFIFLRKGFPINILTRVKEVPEVVTLFCATANPVEVIVAQSAQGRGVLGVIDGGSPLGVEGADGIAWRHGLLRKFGYKR